MQVIKNNRVILCDIDDTLVMHVPFAELTPRTRIRVPDPLNPNSNIPMKMNLPMIRCLKEEIQRGAQIIAMSRGGHEWAANVLKALKLDKHGIIVCDKPFAYFDDKDVSEWLKDRVYIPADAVYKTENR